MLRTGSTRLARALPVLCEYVSVQSLTISDYHADSSIHRVSHAPSRAFASTSRLRLDSSASTSPSQPQSSVHASEIEHFSKLSSQWWDEHGEFGLLHAMNPARIQFIREKLEEVWGWEAAQRQVHGEAAVDTNLGKTRFLDGLDVVDIGCGGGLLSESLARLGARTTGVDASASNIGIATTHAAKDPALSREHSLGGPNLSYRHATAEQLVTEGKQFDVVCAMEVIEHVNGPADFLRSLDQLVKVKSFHPFPFSSPYDH